MKKTLLILFILVSNIFAFEHLTVENFDEKIKDKNVIIDFYATWCPPCKIIDKNLKNFDKSKPEGITIYKVDIDAQRDLLSKFSVKSIPTLVYVVNGELKYLTVGVQSEEEISQNTEIYLVK